MWIGPKRVRAAMATSALASRRISSTARTCRAGASTGKSTTRKPRTEVARLRGASSDAPRSRATSDLGLRVVLLPVDAPALHVLAVLDMRLLASADVAIAARTRFGPIHMRLTRFQPARFAVRQLTRCHALLDALFLIDVALDIGLHTLRRSRIRIAGLRVMFFARDIAACLVLRRVDTRAFGSGNIAVAQRA